MFSKTFVFALVALLALNGASARYTPYAIEERGFSDIFDGIIKGVQSVVHLAEDALTGLGNIIGNLVEFTMKQFEKAVDKAHEVVGAAIEQAQQLGIDVTTCVLNEEKNFNELKNAVKTQIYDYKDKKFAQVQVVVENIKKKYQQVVDKFDEYKIEISHCESWGFICYGNIFAKAVNYSETVITDIKHIKDDAVALIDIKEAEQELGKIKDTAEEKAEIIKNEIFGCIADLMPGHNQQRALQTRDILNIIESLIEKVKKVAGTLFDGLKNVLNNIKNNAVNICNELIAVLKSEIQDFIDEAADAKVDVKECIAEQNKQFEQLKNKLLEGITNAIEGKVVEGKEKLDKVMNFVNKLISEVEYFKNKLGDCHFKPHCLLGVGEEIYEKYEEADSETGKLIKDFEIFINSVKKVVQEQSEELLKTVSNDGKNIANTIIQCIKYKLTTV